MVDSTKYLSHVDIIEWDSVAKRWDTTDTIFIGDAVSAISVGFAGYGIVREIVERVSDSCLHGGTTTSTYLRGDVLPLGSGKTFNVYFNSRSIKKMKHGEVDG